ncbi:MAG: hypothetical protein ABI613_04035 [Gemmatimonadota bacterium]
MSGTTIILLRLIHILSGVFWVGSVLFVARFLMPALRAIGPASGPVMQQLTQVRKLPLFMMIVAILTILSGITLYWQDSGGFTGAWIDSAPGRVFGLGGILAIVAGIIGMAINTPTGRKMGELGAAIGRSNGPPSPEQVAEIGRLQGKMYSSMQVVAVLLVLATAAMAIARYVR